MTHYLTADSRMQPYLMFPRFLMELEIPDTAKLLYMLLLDRARVSQRTPQIPDGAGNTGYGKAAVHAPARPSPGVPTDARVGRQAGADLPALPGEGACGGSSPRGVCSESCALRLGRRRADLSPAARDWQAQQDLCAPSRRRKTDYETVGKPSVRQAQFRLSDGRKSVH